MDQTGRVPKPSENNYFSLNLFRYVIPTNLNIYGINKNSCQSPSNAVSEISTESREKNQNQKFGQEGKNQQTNWMTRIVGKGNVEGWVSHVRWFTSPAITIFWSYPVSWYPHGVDIDRWQLHQQRNIHANGWCSLLGRFGLLQWSSQWYWHGG